jgi:hypothetical protein
LAAFDQALAASIILFSFSLLLAVRTFESCAAATAFHLYALNVLEKNEDWAGQVAGETSEQ